MLITHVTTLVSPTVQLTFNNTYVHHNQVSNAGGVIYVLTEKHTTSLDVVMKVVGDNIFESNRAGVSKHFDEFICCNDVALIPYVCSSFWLTSTQVV